MPCVAHILTSSHSFHDSHIPDHSVMSAATIVAITFMRSVSAFATASESKNPPVLFVRFMRSSVVIPLVMPRTTMPWARPPRRRKVPDPLVVPIHASVASTHRAVGHHDDEHRAPFAGVNEKPSIGLEQRVEKRVAAAVSRKRVDRLVQLLAVGGGRDANANLPSCRDERDFRRSWKRVEKGVHAGAELRKHLRDGCTRVDEHHDAQRSGTAALRVATAPAPSRMATHDGCAETFHHGRAIQSLSLRAASEA